MRIKNLLCLCLCFLPVVSLVGDLGEEAVRAQVCLELRGAVQRIQGKRYVEGVPPVAKLENGQLTFATLTQWIDPGANAQATAAFAQALRDRDIPFLAAIGPTKLTLPGAQMPQGIPDYGNAMGDAFLAALEGQAETFDLRPGFLQGPDLDRYFFSTDHHWTPEGALWGCRVLMEELHRRYGFPIQAEALDPDRYEVTVHKNVFLGSQGKQVGRCYGGVDDFSVFSPRFATAFRYELPQQNLVRTGTFAQALCFPEHLATGNLFQSSHYSYYSGGDWDKAVLTNLAYPEGPRILLIRESFSGALAPFLALQCGELVTIDPRHYQGDLLEEVEALSPDLVLFFCSASSVRGQQLFSLFPGPGETSTPSPLPQ